MFRSVRGVGALRGQLRNYAVQSGLRPRLRGRGGKRRGLPFYLVSFGLGVATAQFVPLSDFYQRYLSQLPTEPQEIAAYCDKMQHKLESEKQFQRYANDTENYDKIQLKWSQFDTMNKSLYGPGGFSIDPVMFKNKNSGDTVTFLHLGMRLCGYPFIIHGGILATVLDEVLKLSFIGGDAKLISTVKTDKLTLQYKFPTFANNFIVIRCKNIDGEINGRVENLSGRVLVKGVGTFEYYKNSSSWLGSLLGFMSWK